MDQATTSRQISVFLKVVTLLILHLVSGSWTDGYKCHSGQLENVFSRTKSSGIFPELTKEGAKDYCARACDGDADCYFAELLFNENAHRCSLKSLLCGNWESNTNSAYSVYVKQGKSIHKM